MKKSDRGMEWLQQHEGVLPNDEYQLLCRAYNTLMGNILEPSEHSTNPLPWHPWHSICPSATGFRGIWNWDSAFHIIGVSRWDPALAREQVHIFMDMQMPLLLSLISSEDQ